MKLPPGQKALYSSAVCVWGGAGFRNRSKKLSLFNQQYQVYDSAASYWKLSVRRLGGRLGKLRGEGGVQRHQLTMSLNDASQRGLTPPI